NLSSIANTLATNANNISTSIKNISTITTDIKNSTKNLSNTLQTIGTLTQTLNETGYNTNQLVKGLQNNTLNNINTVLLPNLNQTTVHINQTAQQLEQFIATINQNPSALVRGVTDKPTGPGEYR